MTDIEKSNFISYVDSFYNVKSGIYPIKGLTLKMIIIMNVMIIGLLGVVVTHSTENE